MVIIINNSNDDSLKNKKIDVDDYPYCYRSSNNYDYKEKINRYIYD